MAQGLKPPDNPVIVREFETRLLLVVFIFFRIFLYVLYIYIFFFDFFIEARSQPGAPLFNLKIIISVCDTHEIRTYNKGQHQKLIRRFMFSCIRATHARYARTMKGKIPITKKKN